MNSAVRAFAHRLGLHARRGLVLRATAPAALQSAAQVPDSEQPKQEEKEITHSDQPWKIQPGSLTPPQGKPARAENREDSFEIFSIFGREDLR
jgi:hypothetical protein